jgi:arginine exporter protein ArgO
MITVILWAAGIGSAAAIYFAGVSFGIAKAQRELKTRALVRIEDHENTILEVVRNLKMEAA